MSNMVTIETKPRRRPFAAPTAQRCRTSGSPTQGLQVTEKAIKRIRMAMAKEGISPEEGGLRLGVMGGGCSGLSYSIKFDTQPPRARPHLRVRRRARVCRSQVVPVSARHDAGLRRDADAAGVQLHQSQLDALLRLRFVFFVVEGLVAESGPLQRTRSVNGFPYPSQPAVFGWAVRV